MNYNAKPRNASTLDRMDLAALKKYTKKRMPVWRNALAMLGSLIKSFTGKLFSAFASDSDRINVSGGGSDLNTTVIDAGSDSIRVAKFDTPGPKKLQTLLTKLDTIEDINEMAYIIEKYRKAGDKESLKMADDMDRMRDRMIDAYEVAVHAMTDIANKHIPDNVGAVQKAFQKYFDKHDVTSASPEYDEDGEQIVRTEGDVAYYVNIGVREDVIDFVMNADITHWERNSSEDSLLGVLTCRMEPDNGEYKLRVFVTVLDRIALAGRFNVGTEIEGTEVNAIVRKLSKVIEHEMAAHHVVGMIAPVKLPIDETEVTTLLSEIEGVEGVHVDEDEVRVEIPSRDRSILAKVAHTLNSRPKVKALMKKGARMNLVEEDEGHWTYKVVQRQ